MAEIRARTAAEVEPGAHSGRLGRVERMIAATRIRDNQRFLLVAAASILLVLLAFGLLSRGSAAPAAGSMTGVADPGRPDDARRAGARGDVDDRGRGGRGDLHVQDPAGETVALDALERLEFRVGDAGLVEVSVNGKDGRRASGERRPSTCSPSETREVRHRRAGETAGARLAERAVDRIRALIPIVVVLLGSDDEATRWAAFVVFVVGALSDLVDGYLARGTR